jgi:phosphonate transport system substrate-binding protein
MSRYGNIVENFVSEHLDGAFFGSFTYALAHSMLGVEVLARPELSDGTSTYHGHIFVRKDSGIRSAADMKGKRFAFVDKATTAGYIFPISYFRKNGIVNYKKYLKEAYFTGTHEDTIDDVLTGRTDVGAAKNTVYDRIENEDKRIKKELVIIAESGDVPENGLAVRKDLDAGIRNNLKAALLAMDADQEGMNALKSLGAKRFIDTTEADYKYVYEYARETGIDLAQYDYRNDR